jgi:hypothetical protein
MGDGRIALVCGAALVASMAFGRAGIAQPSGGDGSAEAPAQGTDTVKDPKLAKKLFAAGQGFERKGDQLAKQSKADDAKAQYLQAVNAYGKAIEAGDDPSWTLALAAAEDKAGDPASGYKQIKALLAAQPPIAPELQKKAQAQLDELDGKVGKVMLTITPAGTQIMIAGQTVGEAPMTEPLVLSPGSYVASLAAVGFEPKDTELKIEAGSETERKIVLTEVVATPVRRQLESEPEQPAATAPPMIPLYVGGGATAVLLTTSIVYDFRAKHQHDAFTAKSTSPNDRLDARDNGKLFAHVADITLVGALGAAAFSGYWYWYKVRPALAAHEQPPKVGLGPWVEPDASGLIVAGQF